MLFGAALIQLLNYKGDLSHFDVFIICIDTFNKYFQSLLGIKKAPSKKDAYKYFLRNTSYFAARK